MTRTWRSSADADHASLSIVFDGSLWAAVYEVRHPDGTCQVARHVFGPEPSSSELWEWVHRCGVGLIERAHAAPVVSSTASQDALRETLEANKKHARSSAGTTT